MSSDDIAYNKNDILSYTVNFENYTGGAHGAHSFTNHVIDMKTGNLIKEDDIFIEGFQEDLAQILIDRIAKQNTVENPKELENIGFFSIDEIFPNGNFLIDDNGITYTFNEYEIAAYVVGCNECTSSLRRNTISAQKRKSDCTSGILNIIYGTDKNLFSGAERNATCTIRSSVRFIY